MRNSKGRDLVELELHAGTRRRPELSKLGSKKKRTHGEVIIAWE